jgi:hypothetical protein
MNDYIPPRPTGDDEESRYHQAVWDAIFGGRFPFIDQPGVCQWSRTTKGYYPVFGIPRRGGGPTGGAHPFKINRTGEMSFTLTQGYVDVPIYWPSVTTPRDIEIGGEKTHERVLVADYAPETGWFDFAFSIPDGFTYDVWVEIAQSQGSPGVMTASVQTGLNGPRMLNMLKADSLTDIMQIPIGSVNPEEILQFTRSHVTDTIHTAALVFQGSYQEDRIYFPGDVVVKDVLTAPIQRSTYVLEGRLIGERAHCYIGFEPGLSGSSPWTPIGYIEI